MDIPEFDPDTKLQISDETYPGAKEQQQEFLDALKLDNQEKLVLIHKALRLCVQLRLVCSVGTLNPTRVKVRTL